MKKNLYAFIFGIVISIGILSCLEGFYQFNRYSHLLTVKPKPIEKIPWDKKGSDQLYLQLKDSVIYKWKSILPDDFPEDPNADASEKGNLPCCIGIKPPVINEHIVSKKYTEKDHRLIYSAEFNFDSLGRRKSLNNPAAKMNILLLGDSFTLGEGVNDDQTTAFQLGLMRPQAQVYNFGISGAGPNQVLLDMQLTKNSRFDDIPKRRTIVIYTLINHHMERLIARSSSLKPDHDWILQGAYYEPSPEGPIYKGNLGQDRKALNWFYRLWHQSAFVNFYDLTLPPYFTQKHFDFFASMAKEMEKQAKQRFGDVDFYVSFYPGESNRYAKQLELAFKRQDVKYLDYSHIDMWTVTDNRSAIPGDGHPSPVTHFVYAYLLNKDLPP